MIAMGVQVLNNVKRPLSPEPKSNQNDLSLHMFQQENFGKVCKIG